MKGVQRSCALQRQINILNLGVERQFDSFDYSIFCLPWLGSYDENL